MSVMKSRAVVALRSPGNHDGNEFCFRVDGDPQPHITDSAAFDVLWRQFKVAHYPPSVRLDKLFAARNRRMRESLHAPTQPAHSLGAEVLLASACGLVFDRTLQ